MSSPSTFLLRLLTATTIFIQHLNEYLKPTE
jgi:hypothetical protein